MIVAGPYSFALNSLTSPGMVAATLSGLEDGRAHEGDQ